MLFCFQSLFLPASVKTQRGILLSPTFSLVPSCLNIARKIFLTLVLFCVSARTSDSFDFAAGELHQLSGCGRNRQGIEVRFAHHQHIAPAITLTADFICPASSPPPRVAEILLFAALPGVRSAASHRRTVKTFYSRSGWFWFPSVKLEDFLC